MEGKAGKRIKKKSGKKKVEKMGPPSGIKRTRGGH